MKPIEFTVSSAQSGVRADKILQEVCPEISRSAAQKAIEAGALLKDGQPISKNTKLKSGDFLCFLPPEEESLVPKAENIPLDIVYEDDDLLIVNKPKGMVVHPAPGHTENTLVSALLYHCGEHLSKVNGELRPGILHRIDKDTSGLLMVAKTDFAHEHLAEQIAVHSFKREYRGIILGHLKEPNGSVDAPIGRNPKDRKKMAVTLQNSKEARTDYETLEQYAGYSFMRFVLHTGRTHQIRVHMAHLGHPLAGDAVYGTPKNKAEKALEGQCLHAALLGFVHPRTQEYLEFTAPLPTYFEEFKRKLSVKN